MHPLATYLAELKELHDSGAGVKETSGYGVLQSLLNTAGGALKPKVRCLIQLKNAGAGMPDGGFFTPDQLKNADEQAPLHGVPNPARGVLEVKGPGEELEAVALTRQVQDYLGLYGQALLTNYRDFLLVQRGPGGALRKLEAFRLAESEAAFWNAAARPRQTVELLGERFHEYLKRVLLHAAPLNNPDDLAFFLASYARDARARVEHAGELPALAAIRAALEESLGMKFDAQKGEHFFRSTLVQTLFYGVFSAWVLWHKENPLRQDEFDWRAAAWTLHVPMIKALFEQVATPTKLGPLGLVEPLDWTAAALNRVDRPVFFQKFLETHAVQYFYEPFLEAFDPELRKELGVWYTPPEIVQYQVARVDAVLREELDLPDGLADPRVFVLDPCCGTGAYLVETLRRIVAIMREEKRLGAVALAEAKQAAMRRVFGFELMPAPFVVAHLQMGLLLQSLGVGLDENKGERAGIFLTNSLTGWDFTGENPFLAQWPELAAEAMGAATVKKDQPILVIMGNPPYNAYAGVSPEEENGLVEVYKGAYQREKILGGKKAPKGMPSIKKIKRYLLNDPVSEGGWGIRKFNLDELYVRFFRIAERKIAERTKRGVVCFISNFSYLEDASFVIMRQRLLKEFDALWFDCLNGDSRETGKLTPDGKPDPSIFSTELNREGIRVGTAVGLLVRKETRRQKPVVRYREFWGGKKRLELVASLGVKNFNAKYEIVKPAREDRFSFRPSRVTRRYLKWPRLTDLCAEPPINGLMEKRGGGLMDYCRQKLEQRMRQYFDPQASWDSLAALKTGLTKNAAGFEAGKVREKLLAKDCFRADHVRRYALRPFDIRWCYYSEISPLWNRSRPQLWAQCWPGNAFLLSRPAGVASPEGVPFSYTPLLGDNDFLRGHAYYFPFWLRAGGSTRHKKRDDGNGEFASILRETAAAYGGVGGKRSANLASAARAYLAQLGFKHPDEDQDQAALLWHHALAIGYAPEYLSANADGLRGDWPRVPLPADRQSLLASAALGRQVAALLDTETPVPGVTAGAVRSELRHLAELHSATAPDFKLTAGWGRAGKEGVTMPGKGRLLARAYHPQEKPAPDGQKVLGRTTNDVYLNDSTYWRNVPERVWEFTIGGYQVIKKWLSYREHGLLGRPLTPEEAGEITHTARRLAGLLLLQPELDRNYRRVAEAPHPWNL